MKLCMAVVTNQGHSAKGLLLRLTRSKLAGKNQKQKYFPSYIRFLALHGRIKQIVTAPASPQGADSVHRGAQSNQNQPIADYSPVDMYEYIISSKPREAGPAKPRFSGSYIDINPIPLLSLSSQRSFEPEGWALLLLENPSRAVVTRSI